MDDEVTTPFWVKFFTDAGIPQSSAASYAIIFDQNRIKKDMLLDLNKEYLKDMGVNVLGDIIAILKHSKIYHEKVARERILNVGRDASIQKATREALHKENTVKSVTSPIAKPAPVAQVVSVSPPKKLRIVQSQTIKPVINHDNDSMDTDKGIELKRKVISSLSPLTRTVATPTVSVNAVKAVPKKSSVFQRLGESNVSSTTPEIPEPCTTISKSSVFNRLGGVEKEADSPSRPTVTRKILSPTFKSKPQPKLQLVTELKTPVLRMDVESSGASTSAKQRLGSDKPSTTKLKVGSKVIPGKSLSATSKRPVLQPPRRSADSVGIKQRIGTTTVSSGVKQRIGGAKSNAIVNRRGTGSSTSSVFSRLTISNKKK